MMYLSHSPRSKAWLCLVATLSLALVGATFGCSRKNNSNSSAGIQASNQPLTYHQDIAPIMRANCADCHRPDGGGPFSLLTHHDVAARANQIADVVASGYMPPWPPDSSVNSFVGEHMLTPEQNENLRRWADAGAPEGQRLENSPENEWSNDWSLGEPDLVVSFDQPFEVPAGDGDIYRNFVVPIPVNES